MHKHVAKLLYGYISYVRSFFSSLTLSSIGKCRKRGSWENISLPAQHYRGEVKIYQSKKACRTRSLSFGLCLCKKGGEDSEEILNKEQMPVRRKNQLPKRSRRTIRPTEPVEGGSFGLKLFPLQYQKHKFYFSFVYRLFSKARRVREISRQAEGFSGPLARLLQQQQAV